MLKIYPKKIICAGLRRSGSTWLYNVVKIACKKMDFLIESKFVNTLKLENKLTSLDFDKTCVFKMHHYSSDFNLDNSIIFVTIRDFRDVVASCQRRNLLSNNLITDDYGKEVNFNNLSDVKSFLDNEKNNFFGWSSKACMIIPYRNIAYDKIATIQKICDVLNFKISANDVFQEVENLQIPETEVDKNTELWPHHITSGKNLDFNEVSADVIKFIEDNYFEYLEDQLCF
jgi:hypothetical protein